VSLKPHLWNVMASAAGDAAKLRTLLMGATAEQLILLARRFDEASTNLSSKFANVPAADRSRTADVVVTHGQRLWNATMQDQDAASSIGNDASDFRQVFRDVYRERFGHELPSQEPDPAADPTLRFDPRWEEELWKLIEVINVGVPSEQATSLYTRSELAQLGTAAEVITDWIEDEISRKTGRPRVTEKWTGLSHWLLGQGKEAVEHYVSHTEQLPEEADMSVPWLAGMLLGIYDDRYSADLPYLPRERFGDDPSEDLDRV
jgi:hypothetical protein